MSDTEFGIMRRAMIDSQLRTSGVTDAWIIAAMGAVPREAFVPKHLSALAYMDRSVPLGNGRALNPPLSAGLMLNMAAVQPNDAVLLIGAGSGYLASILARHATKLVVVEGDAALLTQARNNLVGSDAVNFVDGPLNEGAPAFAPYDLIIIDGAVPNVPGAILQQLVEGGRVVTGVIEGAVHRLAIGYRRSGRVALRSFADTEIASLPGFAPAREFVF